MGLRIFATSRSFCRQRRLAVGPQHVEIAVLARHVDPAAGNGDRRGDRRAERRRERPRLAAGQRHDVQLAVQAAVDDVVARQHGRADGGRRAEHVRLLLAGAVPAQAQALLGPHPINVVAADAHRGEAQQAGQMDRRLGSLDEIRLHLAVGQAQDFDPTGVVAAVPLDVDVAGLIGALAERGGVFGAGVVGDHADRAQAAACRRHLPGRRCGPPPA